MEFAPTQAQRKAIQSTGHSLLVSAAAGSGKTSVLAHRCVYLVCDAPHPCDVDELLVVTFTEAAAAEMRTRIQAALVERVGASTDPRLRRQLAMIDHAQIGTLHGFCTRLLKQNFTQAGLDPQFSIIDDHHAQILRRQVAGELFDACFAAGDGAFTNFVNAYSSREEDVASHMILAHQLLASLPDPERFLRDCLDRIAEAGEKPLADSDLGGRLLREVQQSLARLSDRCAATLRSIRALGAFPGYESRVVDYAAQLAGWQSVFATAGYEALRAAHGEFGPGRLPPLKDSPGKKQAQEIIGALREAIRAGDLADLLAFSEAGWLAAQQAILPHARLLAELAVDFTDRYSRAKARIGVLDFSDLERKALALLADSPSGLHPTALAHELHQQYRHVLVDEYQDINHIQDAILSLVSTECLFAHAASRPPYPPNLFTVGDIKQSVYRFRLADPKRFTDRADQFRTASRIGAVIDLQENFRTLPALLDRINQVFSRLMTQDSADLDYDASHRLIAGRAGGGEEMVGAPIELRLLPVAKPDPDEEQSLQQSECEACECAAAIQELRDQGRKFSDIAILLRSVRNKSERFARILRRHNIPVQTEGGAGFFAAAEIRDVLAVLQLLDNFRQDIPLAAYLAGPLAGIDKPHDALARVRLAYPGREVPFHQAVMQYATARSDDLAGELGRHIARLTRWRDLAAVRPLADLIWTLYNETGCLAYVAGLDDGAQAAANLLLLHAKARDFGGILGRGLHHFMDFLAELREHEDLGLPSISEEVHDAVRIMSIHKSKGLEFPVVLLPDLGKGHNLSDTRRQVLLDRGCGLGLKAVDLTRQIRYASLSSVLAGRDIRRQTLAEELRLLYVAMTRAKDRLILIGSVSPEAPAKWSARYANHQGPLPPDDFLSARTMLDWLGPAAAMGGDSLIEVHQRSAEDVAAYNQAASLRQAESAQRQSRADFVPLSPPPPRSAEAERLIAALEFIYPHAEQTRRPAAQSATAAAHDLLPPDPLAHRRGEPKLSLPRFMVSGATQLAATDVGHATHTVLEHLDYARPCDAADLEAQIGRLVAAGRLPVAHAAAVDRSAILWFVSTPLGQIIKGAPGRIRREVPFASSDGQGADSPMIRGRLDLLVEQNEGVLIVDYKTDRLRPDEVEARAAEYRPQLHAYRDALQRVARRKVASCHLVFLHPRVIQSV